MLNFYSKLEKNLSKLEKILVTLMMMIMFVSVFIQVLSRFFNLPIPDTSDISLVSFAMMTFFGTGLLVYTKGHILIEITSLIKSQKIVFIFDVLSNIAMLIIGAILLNIGFALLMYFFENREATMALRIPLAVPFTSLVIGLVLMLVHTIGNLMVLFNKYKTAN
ncbi:TRAP transporter small permease [Alkalicoccus saliphilus]|uniref:TRAP transporter small permease n=1 Tax=Alkalicoccus saliphilus TaxID=200989 RepID=UPI001359E5FE|nr:TRAP transporter small permease [Alkalicoccus saliphilus]